MACSGILHHLFHFLMRIVAAIGKFLVFSRIKSFYFTFAPGTFSRQLRPALHFDSPSLIVGQVPMEIVHLVECHIVKHLLNIGNGEIMPRHIEMLCAESKPRIVVHGNCRQYGTDSGAGWQQLYQRLHTVEHACRRSSFDNDTIASRDAKPVFFLSHTGILIPQKTDSRIFRLFHQLGFSQRNTEIGFHIVGQIFSSRQQHLVGNTDNCPTGNFECTLPLRYFHRSGNNIIVLGGSQQRSNKQNGECQYIAKILFHF